MTPQVLLLLLAGFGVLLLAVLAGVVFDSAPYGQHEDLP